MTGAHYHINLGSQVINRHPPYGPPSVSAQVDDPFSIAFESLSKQNHLATKFALKLGDKNHGPQRHGNDCLAPKGANPAFLFYARYL